MLNFTMLDVLYVEGKKERGEELTDRDLEIVKHADELRAQMKAREREKERLHQIKQQEEYETAISMAESRICPLRGSECMGRRCAWFKVAKGKYNAYDKIQEYDAMCAVCVPERGSRIER